MRAALALIAFVVAGFLPCQAESPKACIGNVAVSKFQLVLEPAQGGPPLPLNAVNVVQAGQKLKYEPLHSSPELNRKAKIALLLVPAPEEPSKDLVVLEAKSAKAPAEWRVPLRASVAGVVFGPRGLDIKKVSSLVEKNRDLIPQLADYAQETATVEALVQKLSEYEQAPPGSRDLDAALRARTAVGRPGGLSRVALLWKPGCLGRGWRIANGEYARPHVSGHRPSLRLCDAAGIERDAALYQAPAAEVASPPRLSLDAAHSRRWSAFGVARAARASAARLEIDDQS